jgi:hypothetical protein
MNTLETITFAIETKMAIRFMYDSELRFVAPLCVGDHKDSGKLVVMGYYMGGFSKSKLEGSDTSNLRIYELDKINNIDVDINVDFTISKSPAYIKKSFSKVIKCFS